MKGRNETTAISEIKKKKKKKKLIELMIAVCHLFLFNNRQYK